MRYGWFLMASAGCITGRGLSDDEQLPGLDGNGTSPTNTSPTVDPLTALDVRETDSDDACGSSALSLRATGATGAIAVSHAGVEMGDCVGWTPGATLDEDVITLSYTPDDGVGNCTSTCPMDFAFTITVAAGDYVVVWQDEAVEVTVD